MKTIHVLGSINTDIVIEAPYFPKQGETLTGTDFFTAQGGKGANQAVAAARLGGKVKMCGAVGNDDFGQASLINLKAENIDVRHIKISKVSSGTAVIVLCEHDNRIILHPGANHDLSHEDVDSFLMHAEKGDIFIAQLENKIDLVGYALKVAKQKEMFVILNPAPANKDIIPYLKYVDLFTPNEGECELFGGKQFLKDLIPHLIVTLGGDGYLIADKNSEQKYPCMKVSPVDTTAAGDTFTGGLATYLSKGHSLEEAARFGSISASIACTRKGAQPSIPNEEEVKKYL